MNKKYLFIVNPTAGNGKTAHLIDRLKKLIIKSKIEYKIVTTESRGHIDSIINSNTSSYNRFIVVGGDGTAHDLINSKSILDVVCGVIPTGNGNDFAATLKMKKNLEKDLSIIINDNISKLDVGIAEIINQDGTDSSARFINSIGIGFDAAVAAGAQTIDYLSGLTLYLVSIFKNLIRYKMSNFIIKADELNFSGTAFMVSVGNGKTAGGGFLLTPNAEPDDGLLDYCLIKKINKFKAVFTLLPKSIIGKHITSHSVIYSKTRQLDILVESPLYVHADGEILTNLLKRIKISLMPKMLNIISNR
jgi:YegS/Rv2252/BmrU family lipid kinase